MCLACWRTNTKYCKYKNKVSGKKLLGQRQRQVQTDLLIQKRLWRNSAVTLTTSRKHHQKWRSEEATISSNHLPIQMIWTGLGPIEELLLIKICKAYSALRWQNTKHFSLISKFSKGTATRKERTKGLFVLHERSRNSSKTVDLYIAQGWEERHRWYQHSERQKVASERLLWTSCDLQNSLIWMEKAQKAHPDWMDVQG